MSAYIFWQLALADFRERARRYSFFVMLASLCYLGYMVLTGKMGLWVSGYQGVRNSAWVGAVMMLIANTMMGLAGFYFVKSTISRDAETRVGQILAAARVSRLTYIFSKVASNFAVYCTMLALLFVFAIVMQIAFGDGHPVNLWQLASPFLLFSVPCLLVYSACAVLFECIPGLRGGIGNIVFFMLWNGLLVLSITTRGLDFTGIRTIGDRMHSIVAGIDPNVKEGITLGSMGQSHVLHFVWNGLPWTTQIFAERMIWVLIAFALALIAALLFSTFDPFTQLNRWNFSRPGHEEENAIHQQAASRRTSAAQLSLARANDKFFQQWLALTRIELRMLLPRRAPKLWLLTSAGLVIAQAASPFDVARHELLALAWIWPILAWSKMGTGQSSPSADQLLIATAGYVRQLFACWTAGVLLAAATAAPIFMRLVFHRMWPSAVGWLIAAAFIPAMALGLGSISRTPRLFEICYFFLWYVGPMHRIPALDFTGASSSAELLIIYAALTTILLAASFLWRTAVAHPQLVRLPFVRRT